MLQGHLSRKDREVFIKLILLKELVKRISDKEVVESILAEIEKAMLNYNNRSVYSKDQKDEMYNKLLSMDVAISKMEVAQTDGTLALAVVDTVETISNRAKNKAYIFAPIIEAITTKFSKNFNNITEAEADNALVISEIIRKMVL